MIYYKLENEDGNAFTGFKTIEEAFASLKDLRKDKTWSIIAYEPDDWEQNYV